MAMTQGEVMITQELLKEFLRYDPETGAFTWLERSQCRFKTVNAFKTWNTRYSGKIAGNTITCNRKKYKEVCLNGKSYKAHRLAFLYMAGEFPEHVTDHINGKGLDNRWRNLRAVTTKENSKNLKLNSRNTSGFSGVTIHKGTGKWCARIMVDGENKNLGLFRELSDAVRARLNAENSLGFHANHGA
jgi:hypothetical protein